MSISSEIIRIYDNIQHAYDAVREKGGTVPGEAILVSIAVTSTPTKTSYNENETLNLTGLVVTATYDDSSTKTVTSSCTFTPAAGTVLKSSNKSVAISYTEGGVTKEASFAITVKAAVPTDKTFANATDAEFLQIAQALQAGTISVSDLSGWDVGATRSVSLGSFTSYPSGSAATQAAQTAQLVILHKKSNGVCAGKQFADGTIPSFIIGFKDNVAKSYYHGSSNKYESSLLFTVENNIYNALPTDIKSAFGKQFKAITGVYSGKTTRTDNRNMCSPAARELFGGSDSASEGSATSYAIKAEHTALGSNAQFDYYKTDGNNRRKHTNLSNYWWERSPDYDYGGYACYVYSGGTANDGSVYNTFGLAPFGCI